MRVVFWGVEVGWSSGARVRARGWLGDGGRRVDELQESGEVVVGVRALHAGDQGAGAHQIADFVDGEVEAGSFGVEGVVDVAAAPEVGALVEGECDVLAVVRALEV